ncbi:hypothetical protein VCRA2117O380_80096 [Vibrio crassostreae]|nr:hypothetical protein VCRA2117O328_200083 [Vibrio crassostreae]CAK2179710.1 hypothetical protein VCRA2116O234_50092 [Vibrio crassostreae]CAK2223976.1 hypothetical protein VCRA2117O380_80096 [Vibrio crassostreae]CAK3022234.1 hypothetical protein VCRA2119O42_70094 [Vibrio crassostreae]CAK3052386.1 hypothetical protein VCRA2110O183_70083 [Vibrio crassostreae]
MIWTKSVEVLISILTIRAND